MLTSEGKHRFAIERKDGENDTEWGSRVGQIVAWCFTNFGGPGFYADEMKYGDETEEGGKLYRLIIGGYYAFNGATFFFSRERDAAIFKIRWC